MSVTVEHVSSPWHKSLKLHPVPAAIAFATLLSLLILVLSGPAFGSFFLGEDFLYLGQYRAAGGDYWRAILSPTGGIFFRPVFSAVNLLWHFVLPPEPFAHHLRNFAFTLVMLVLLDQVLRRCVKDYRARLIAISFVAVSKIHLTTIGYINVYDSILSTCLILLTVLFFMRARDNRQPRDLFLGYLCAALATATKDYGLVVAGVVTSIAAVDVLSSESVKRSATWWWPRLVPLVPIVVLYLIVRSQVVGGLPTANSVYTPELSLYETGRKFLAFTSMLANLSFLEAGTSGAFGLGGSVFRFAAPDLDPHLGEAVCYLAFLFLAVVTVARARSEVVPMILPLVWIGAYLGPTLLTRNLQMYYFMEPLVGVSVLLAIAVSGRGLRTIVLWAAVIAVIAVSGAMSNYRSLYHWQFAANLVAQIRGPLLDAHRGERLESVTVATTNIGFWRFGLAPNDAPLVPTLTRLPGLRVRFVELKDVALTIVDQRNLLFDADNGFAQYVPGQLPTAPLLIGLSPERVRPGERFNPQPNGQSALGVATRGATRATVVVIAGRRLATSFGSSTFVSALVPADIVQTVGHYPVYLSSPFGDSATIDFVVSDETPRTPIIKSINPTRTQAGMPFNTQANGGSAISILCDDATLGVVVVFDGRPLETAFGGPRLVTATIPAALLARAGTYEIYLRLGTVESNRATFTVDP